MNHCKAFSRDGTFQDLFWFWLLLEQELKTKKNAFLTPRVRPTGT